MIGTILGGRYEILEEIGKGGMAYVYKARCVMLNRIVAVKVLRNDLEGGEEFLQRFNSEAQAAASLTHPNIVGIFDVGIDDGKHYIVMEYVEGITLKNYISQNGRLPYEEALDIAHQISDALQAAHSKNIVHRDIKPHNILITDEGKIKVTDFGIARSGTGNTLSTGDDILGSVHYISPEQARGESVDRRSDLYSLGIVMYEMISGKLPFESDSPVAVAMMQIEETAESIMWVDRRMPETVEQIIFKAIAKDPDLRYQDAEDMKIDIIGVLDNPNYIMPDGHLYVNKKDRRNPVVKDNDIPQKPLKTSSKVTAILFAVLTSLLIVAVAIAISQTGIIDAIKSSFNGSAIKAPELVGKTLEEAQYICEKNKLRLVIQDEVENSSAEPGTVISQDPAKGEEFESNDNIVYVVINKSEKNNVLKDYFGVQYRSARDELEKWGYEVDVIFEESQKETDTILRQSPEAGTKLSEDTKITLYVSKGTEESDNLRTVPYVIDKTYIQAVNLLEAAGLTVGDVVGVNNITGSEIVTSQSIPAGSKVAKNCAVTISLRAVQSQSEEQEEEPSENEDNQEEPVPEETHVDEVIPDVPADNVDTVTVEPEGGIYYE